MTLLDKFRPNVPGAFDTGKDFLKAIDVHIPKPNGWTEC